MSLPSPRLFALLSLLLTIAVVPRVRAQDADAVQEELSERIDPLLVQLESNAARGGIYRARAVASLIRLGEYEKANRWLGEIANAQDADLLADSAQEIGNQLLLRISLQEGLSAASRQAVERMSAALTERDRSLTRLDAAVKQLASAKSDDQLNASRTLLQAGEPGIGTLASALAAGLDDQTARRAIGILRRLGADSVKALDQLCLYAEPQSRLNASASLAGLSSDRAIDNLVSLAFDPSLSEQQRVDAVSTLRDVAGMKESDRFEALDAIALLTDRLKTLRRHAGRTPNDELWTNLWSVDESRSKVNASRSYEFYQRYRNAYDMAQRLFRFEALPPTSLREALSADLSYRVIVDPDWGDPEQIEEFRSAVSIPSIETLNDTLQHAVDNGESAAALGILRLIEHAINDRGASAVQQLLHGSAGGISPLVNASRSSEPRIRYLASSLATSVASAGESPIHYSGSSYVQSTLAEMARLAPGPVAILIETRPQISVNQTVLLGQLGYEVRHASSVAQCEREISAGGDLRMVLSKIRLSDYPPAELVDRVRRQPKGAGVPIVFFDDGDAAPRSVVAAELETTLQRWNGLRDAGVHLVPLPGSIEAFRPILVEVEAGRRLPPLSNSDRTQYRRFAQQHLP